MKRKISVLLRLPGKGAVLILCAVISVCAFWMMPITGNEMIYSILVFYLIIPLAIFGETLAVSKRNKGILWTSIISILSGIIYSLADYFTFSMANMLSTGRTLYPDEEFFIKGIIIAVEGIATGKIRWRNYIK